MMFREEDCYIVKGEGVQRQEFSEMDTALFFALRMSEALGQILTIWKWFYDANTDQMRMLPVRKVKPHEFKLNPAYKRQDQRQQRAEPPRPPPPPQTPLRAAYAFLEVSEDVDASRLRQAFRALSKRYHPDMPGGSTAKFQMLSNHYELIKRTKGYQL